LEERGQVGGLRDIGKKINSFGFLDAALFCIPHAWCSVSSVFQRYFIPNRGVADVAALGHNA